MAHLADDPPVEMSAIPEYEVVAIRTEGPHDHISAVKLADGSTERATRVLAATDDHEGHYFMRRGENKLLIQVRQCPDCNERVLFA